MYDDDEEPPFGFRGWNGLFRNIDSMMERMFRESLESMPKDLIKEERLPDGSVVKRFGPYVYGYSMTVGEDGKPVIREFGNFRPSKTRGLPRRAPERELKESRQPIVDVIDEDKTVRVIAEMPGVEKDQINLEYVDNRVTISARSEMRNYSETVTLPAKIEPASAKASYKNGVLEVTLDKIETPREKKKINIE